MEDKAAITKALLPVLKMTRDHADLVSLEYSKTKNRETVTASYKNHYHVAIDVTADSGIALIIDVITKLHHHRLKWGDKGGAEYGA